MISKTASTTTPITTLSQAHAHEKGEKYFARKIFPSLPHS
jgi:hypothetical protein